MLIKNIIGIDHSNYRGAGRLVKTGCQATITMMTPVDRHQNPFAMIISHGTQDLRDSL